MFKKIREFFETNKKLQKEVEELRKRVVDLEVAYFNVVRKIIEIEMFMPQEHCDDEFCDHMGEEEFDLPDMDVKKKEYLN